MNTEQSTTVCGCKTFAAGSAVEQIATLVFSVLATYRNVALPSQAMIFALYVRAKRLLKYIHWPPPCRLAVEIVLEGKLHVN